MWLPLGLGSTQGVPSWRIQLLIVVDYVHNLEMDDKADELAHDIGYQRQQLT